MTDSYKKARALGLCSGGLDSILSALLLKKQGIAVTWISFETPFFSTDKAKQASALTGIPLIVREITDTYMEMLKNPRMGYGKNMNPCPDCHTLMFNLAGQIADEQGFDFLFSGEVLGQRPMSQNLSALNYVAKNSGYRDKILRPLSAKKLAPTQPEIQGLVDREGLMDFSGRSRKPQMALAKEMGIEQYPTPAGGCLLTDEGFGRRLKDLLAHEGYSPVTRRDLVLLKHGRHFRINPATKVIAGRNKAENASLAALADPAFDSIVRPAAPGPVVFVPNKGDLDGIQTAAAIFAAYSKAPQGESLAVTVLTPQGAVVVPLTCPDRENFRSFLL
ncbi:MAG: tRNA 4-thiouridine(8) synthase ThiI [Desulfatibacillaceae bacterium]|nr:tRNA 4-thiouridine(8) synthase ThiI [Desulfatibacillaceae bacterium]